MGHKISFHKIWSLARNEWVKWVCRSRMLLILLLVVFAYSFVIQPLLQRAEKMGEPLNMLEPLIAIGNSSVLVLILPLVFLVLMCDYPRIDGSTMFTMYRIGRGNWMLGQILFGILSVITYLGTVYVICTAFIMGKTYFYNGWSMVVKKYNVLYPEEAQSLASQLIPGNLYNQFTPYSVAIQTYVLLFSYLLLLILILLFFQQRKQRAIGFIVVVAVISFGVLFTVLKSDAMWIFPMANSLVWLHYTELMKEAVLPEWCSYIYFGVGILIMLIANMLAVRKMNIDEAGAMEE